MLSQWAEWLGYTRNFLSRATLTAVKSLRVWLLILLALALPIRGAMAAAMLFAPASGHVHATASAGHVHEHGSHADAAGHQQAAADQGDKAGHDGNDKCSFCASCCSATFPVAVTFNMPQAPPAGAKFPEYRAPATDFFSGGQERPPRSI
jgi:hypothetical protein